MKGDFKNKFEVYFSYISSFMDDISFSSNPDDYRSASQDAITDAFFAGATIVFNMLTANKEEAEKEEDATDIYEVLWHYAETVHPEKNNQQ